MKPRSIALPGLCAVALAIVGGPVGASAAGGRTVTLRNIAFAPKSLSIARNTTVTFAWRDDGTAHNVVSKGAKRFKSIGVRSAGTQSRKFTSAGTYRYVCTLHPGMAGRITVH
jgi:plastocyanin